MNIERRAAIMGLAALLWAAPAAAHPQMQVTMRNGIVFNDQGLVTALNLDWTFDDDYARMALDGLDANGDGVYSQEELAPLTRENIESLKDYDYFTVIRFNGEIQPLAPVTEYGQLWSNGKLALHLQVPLKTPVDPRKGEVVAKIYDPAFDVGFDYAKDEPVSAIGALPDVCRIAAKPAPTSAEIDQMRAKLPAGDNSGNSGTDEEFAAFLAPAIIVQCKG